MKNILYATIFLTFFSLAQEIDEEYLESLPESIRQDIIEKARAQEDLQKPVYRRASSTMIDKDEQELAESEDSLIFGKKFFDTIQTSFMPINDPNLDDKYVLDFGDVLELQLIGQENSIELYEIKRDGSVNIPVIGKVLISGLPLSEATDLIKAKVNQAFIGTQAFVSLTNIRDITILVSGNAFNPGIYTLNGNSNILHALNMAGGINDYGSYRDIRLIRNNETIDTLDIYDVLVSGKTNFATGLRTGDSIVVSPRGKQVSIQSGVVRKGIYELTENEDFSDLIRYANGISLNADTNNVLIKRIYKGQSKIINIDFEDIKTYPVERGDSLFIGEYKLDSVTIKGAVKYPGIYLIPKGTKISELIVDAGGYEESAYPFGGFLNSQKSLEINRQSKEKLYNKFLDNYISKPLISNNSNQNLSLVLEQLKNIPVSGRIIAEFDLDVISAKPYLDTILEDGDEILIPTITQQIFVQGEVSNPGAARYSPNKEIGYYINNAGGSLDSADLRNIFIVHPNGETTNLASNARSSFFVQNENILVYPGSIIYVPKKSDLTSSIEVASIWAPIISSIALSLTSLSVLNNTNWVMRFFFY